MAAFFASKTKRKRHRKPITQTNTRDGAHGEKKEEKQHPGACTSRLGGRDGIVGGESVVLSKYEIDGTIVVESGEKFYSHLPRGARRRDA